MTKSTVAAAAAFIIALGCLGCRSSEPVAQTTPSAAPQGQRPSDKPAQMHQLRMPPGVHNPPN